MINPHKPATESPKDGYEIGVSESNHPSVCSFATKAIETAQPSWSRLTRATMIERKRIRRSWVTIDACNSQNLLVGLLVVYQCEWMR